MAKDAKPDAWMPLYIGDWDGDTTHLSCEEDGAYGRLVRSYWRNGPPTDDDVKLARIVRMEVRYWRKLRPTLVLFFTVEAGVWRHKRVDEELIRWGEKRERAIERARKGGAAKAASSRKIAALSAQQAVLKGCSSASPTTEEGPSGPSSRSGRFSNLDFREAARAQMGEDWCVSWLDPCRWQDIPSKAVVCRLKLTRERIKRDLRALLIEFETSVIVEQEIAA